MDKCSRSLRCIARVLLTVLLGGILLLNGCSADTVTPSLPETSGSDGTSGVSGGNPSTTTTPPPETTQGYSLPESLYGPEDFAFEGDYLSCIAGNAMVGIDVSHHQGAIDWQKVADAGIEFVFVRLGYRGYETGALVTDNRALQNMREAREAGLLVGAYFFSQAITVMEAQEEARYALDIIGDFKLDLPLVYDWEYLNETARTANVESTELTEFTIAFCEAVKNGGCEPMLYFSSNQAKHLLDMEKLERYAWWIAMYELENPLLCKVDAWQYSNSGTVPGISTVVDINLLFTDYGIGQAFAKAEE